MHTKRISLLLLITVFILAACGGPVEGGAVLSVATETPAPTDATVQAPVTGITATADAVVAEATATIVPATVTTNPPTAVPTTAEPSRPDRLVKRIRFPAGATSDLFNGRVEAGQRDVYLFHALAGQSTSLNLTSPGNSANFTLSGLDDGLFYKDAVDAARQWNGALPLTQDYIVVVTAPGTTNYSLQLAITPLPATGSIRGLVFEDTNRDDTPDDDEPVEGALVRLSGGVECQTQLAETLTTAVGGAYAFYELPAGAYCVEVVTDAVTVSSLVELGAGEDAVDVNLSWPGLPSASSIGGLVYEDSNGNGSYDGGEPTIANVGVYLIPRNCDGTGLLDNTVTAADGRYHFTGLQAGNYCAATVGTNGQADKQPITLSTGEARTDLHLRTD